MSEETQTDGRAFLDVSERRARQLLLALVVCSAIGLSLMAYLRYAAFTSQTIDTAQRSYAYNQTLQGRFFPSFVTDSGILGQHVNLIALLWLPVYWIVPTVYSLFLFQSLVISLAAWPVYLLALHKTGNRLTSLIAAAGLLVFPAIISQQVNQIQDDQFGLALLLFAFYFFEVGNFRRFVVFLCLSLLAKETIALPTACFSIYALARHRGLKWVVFPATVSVAYVLVAWKLLLPVWGQVDSLMYSQTSYFADYGNTPLEVLKYFVTHPTGTIEKIFAPDRLWYLFQLLMPLLLVLPFGSWACLVALPNLAMNLLSSNPSLRSIELWYGIFPGALLWASFVSALPLWSRKLARAFGGGDYSRSICVVVLIAGLASYSLWFAPYHYRRDQAYQARRDVIAMIPREATVLSPNNMLAHFSRHRALQSLMGIQFYHRDPNEVFDYDYIVFDRNFALVTDATAQNQLFEMISQLPEYRLVFSRDGVFVYQRVGTPARVLTWGKWVKVGADSEP